MTREKLSKIEEQHMTTNINIKLQSRQSKGTVKNNLNSYPCSKNYHYLNQNIMTHKHGKSTNKEKCHKLHDNAILHHTPTEYLHKYMP